MYQTHTTTHNSQKPVSTEQILHSSRYHDDNPLSVSLPEIAMASTLIKNLGQGLTWIVSTSREAVSTLQSSAGK
jgi:hypothetical protein